MSSINIYVACLASYNNGYLYGRWIDATQGVAAIQEEIQAMLNESPVLDAEEWAIHEYDGFGVCGLSEYESLSVVCEMAEFIEEHGDLAVGLMNHSDSIECARDAIEDHYHGEHDSELDFATNLFDDCYIGSIPESVRYYIDYNSFCRDLFINDYYSIDVNGKSHIFSHY
jgi:antirestriction protein